MASTVVLPEVTATLVNASQAVQNTAQKVLFVGQMVAAGTATAGALVENIGNSGEEDALFGATSMLAAMIRAARLLNPVVIFDAIPLDDDGGATDSTGTLVVAGTTADAAGTLIVRVGSQRNHSYTIAIAATNTPTIVGDAIAAAITADANSPVTAANSTGTVTLTSVNAGTYCNDFGLSMEGAVPSLTFATTPMASGATDPTLTGILDVVGTNRYQGIVWPYADDTTVVRTFLDARFNVTNDVLDGVAFTAKTDSLANHLSTLGALNTQTLVTVADKLENESAYEGPSQLEIPAVKASQFAAIRALRLTDGQSISSFVTTTAPLDQFGGAALASLPYFNTPMINLPVVPAGRGWTQTEIGQINDAGGTIFGSNRTNTNALVGQVYTTFKTDAAGNPDNTWKFLNTGDTGSNIREYYVNNYRATYGQSRLTSGNPQRGRDQVNGPMIIALCEKLYQDLSGPDFTLTQEGEAAIQFYKDNLVVTLDLAAGSATVSMEVPIVTQLRSIQATIKISFTVLEAA
jgi:hypothetical protein